MMLVEDNLTEYKQLTRLTITEYLAKADNFTNDLKHQIEQAEKLKQKKPIK